jgi:predicted amidophosphoribosyltransferase
LEGVNLNSKRRLGPQIVRKRLLTQDCLLCGAGSGETSSAEPVRRICRDCRCPLSTLCAADLAWRSLRPLPRQATALRCHVAAFRYAFPIDKLVQSFKYGHRLALAGYFGRQLPV